MKSITILTLVLTLAACTRHDAPTPIATAVELAPVREETRGSATRYSATVEPDAQVAVAFRVSGYAHFHRRMRERRGASGGRGHRPRTPLVGLASATQPRISRQSVAEARPTSGSGPAARPPEAPGRSSIRW
jgi:hypothetical protein